MRGFHAAVSTHLGKEVQPQHLQDLLNLAQFVNEAKDRVGKSRQMSLAQMPEWFKGVSMNTDDISKARADTNRTGNLYGAAGDEVERAEAALDAARQSGRGIKAALKRFNDTWAAYDAAQMAYSEASLRLGRLLEQRDSEQAQCLGPVRLRASSGETPDYNIIDVAETEQDKRRKEAVRKLFEAALAEG